MSEIDQIVSVSISANSTTPSRQGFGTPLVLAYHTRFVDSYRIYSTLSEMSDDGFTSYDDAYRMAAACFAQDPAPEEVIVGRLGSAPAYTSVLTITSAVEGEFVRFKVIQPTTGTVSEIEYEIQAAETTTTVATAVELLVEAVTGVDAASSSADITVTPTAAGRRVHIYDLENCTIEETTADAGYDTALTALEALNDDWYFVLIDSSSPANVADVAAWVLTRKKMFFAATNSSGELAGTGTLGSSLSALSNDRTVLLYAANSHEFAAAAWCGLGAAQDPGSITWAFKTLAGVTPKSLTSTQRNALEADNINHYQTVAAVKITRPGKVTEGEWIDIRHGIDALEARIKEDVFALFANASKVPFTASGLDLIANAIYGACAAFEGTTEQPGLLEAGSVVVSMPDIDDISDSDKAQRRLTGVRFAANLSGAVHYTSITGTLSNA